ncbi:hypothetical protein DYY67_2160 [Candidatus Nitrosotalea sp. TS]|nr:hypothetical protein [Candidatus Nitrosotalea sp. TS]
MIIYPIQASKLLKTHNLIFMRIKDVLQFKNQKLKISKQNSIYNS